MDKKKAVAYKNLVAEMQNKYPRFDKNSDAELFAPVVDGENICREINLYTYWQGLDYAKKTPKIKYLFVLQDYGCIFDKIANLENIRKINVGFKNTPYISKKFNNSKTDENLMKLFEIIGYDLNKRCDELFFTNFGRWMECSCSKSWNRKHFERIVFWRKTTAVFISKRSKRIVGVDKCWRILF